MINNQKMNKQENVINISKQAEKVLVFEKVPSYIPCEEVRSAFAKFGQVLECQEINEDGLDSIEQPPTKYVLIHIKSSVTRQFLLKNPTKVQDVLLTPSIIHGKLNKKKRRPKAIKIYIGNLPNYKKVSMLELVSLFASFGPIHYVYPVKDTKTGICKGYGFVGFKNHESATKAVEATKKIALRGQHKFFCHYKNGGGNQSLMYTSTHDDSSWEAKHSERNISPTEKPQSESSDTTTYSTQDDKKSKERESTNETKKEKEKRIEVKEDPSKQTTIYFRFGPPIKLDGWSIVEQDDWKYSID